MHNFVVTGVQTHRLQVQGQDDRLKHLPSLPLLLSESRMCENLQQVHCHSFTELQKARTKYWC